MFKEKNTQNVLQTYHTHWSQDLHTKTRVRPHEKEIINGLVRELFCEHDAFIRIDKPRQKRVDCFLPRRSNVNLGKRNCPNRSATNGKSVKRISFFSEETKGKKKQRNQDVVFCSTPLNILVYLVSTFSSKVSKTWLIFLTFEDRFIFYFLSWNKNLSIRNNISSISSKCIFQGYI